MSRTMVRVVCDSVFEGSLRLVAASSDQAEVVLCEQPKEVLMKACGLQLEGDSVIVNEKDWETVWLSEDPKLSPLEMNPKDSYSTGASVTYDVRFVLPMRLEFITGVPPEYLSQQDVAPRWTLLPYTAKVDQVSLGQPTVTYALA